MIGDGSGDVGADQHGAGGLDGHLDHDRQLLALGLERHLGTVDRGLDLERVLAGLDQERVDPALDQRTGLDRHRTLDVAIGDVAQGRQLGPGTDGAHHEALALTGAEALDGASGETRRLDIDLEGTVLEVELAQRDRRAAEGVGLDGIGTGQQVVAVDLRHQVRPRQVQDLRAVLLPPEIPIDRQIAALDLRAHATVEENDPRAGVVGEIDHVCPSISEMSRSAPRRRCR